MGQLKVLLVDDEEEFVDTLAERLRIRKMDTQVATDGEQALRIADADTPHVVLLDVMMPGLGGLEILQQIKGRHPDVQVILLTGQGSAQDGMRGLELGAFDYLMKPVRLADLIQTIKKAHQAAGKDGGGDGQ